MEKPLWSVTREKHLDHLVRVIPLIVMLYAVQSYILVSLSPGAVTKDNVVYLGMALILTIGGFLYYNLKHRIDFFQDHLRITFLGRVRLLPYQELEFVLVPESNSSFSTVILRTREQEKFRIYFADDSDKIKQWIDSRNSDTSLAA